MASGMGWFRFVSLAVVAGTISFAGAEEILSPQTFSERFAREMREALPQGGVEIVSPLQLRISLRKSGDSTVYLSEAFEQYKQDPDAGEDLIARYVAGALESVRGETKIDATRIVPIVKPRSWLADVQESAGAGAVVYDLVNEELAIVYAEDSDNSLSYFAASELAESAIDRAGLRQLAATNLVRILPQIERLGDDGFYTIQAGGDFEASLLVTGTVWTRESFPVKGDHVFAVPARDKLYVTGSDDVEGLKKLRELAARLYRESSHRVSDKVFRLRDNTVSVMAEE